MSRYRQADHWEYKKKKKEIEGEKENNKRELNENNVKN